MPVIGKDCHLILQHDAVNMAGNPMALSALRTAALARAVCRWYAKLHRIQRMRPMPPPVRNSGSILTSSLRILSSIPMGHCMLLPDQRIMPSCWTISHNRKASPSLPPPGFTPTLARWAGQRMNATCPHSIVKVGLNNVGYYFPPANPEQLALSVWDGTLTWETSFWR